MTKKRCMKLLMSEGLDRNTADLLAYVGMMLYDSYENGYVNKNELKDLYRRISNE